MPEHIQKLDRMKKSTKQTKSNKTKQKAGNKPALRRQSSPQKATQPDQKSIGLSHGTNVKAQTPAQS